MARKNDTPQKVALREMMNIFLKEHDIQLEDIIFIKKYASEENKDKLFRKQV